MSIWRNPTEIGYELSATPLLFKNEVSFYLARDAREAELLKKICLFWNNHFPINKIVYPDELKEKQVPEEEDEKLKIHLKVGQALKIKDLIDDLGKLGYERNQTANQEKTFSVRGDVLDVFHGHPIRIEFDNNKIVKIYQFELDSNKKLAELPEFVVYPDKISTNAFIVEEKDLKLEFSSPKFYNLRFRELQSDLEHYLKIKILTKDSPKLRKFIPVAEYLDAPTDKIKLESFILESENLIFLTDDNIFGAPVLEEKGELDEDFIANLQPGDYVVHIDHGVAKYAGPYTDKSGKKFFLLEYAHGDKLYVPWEKGERIDKYIGSPHPKLHRLSEESWLNVVSKIKEQTQKTAEDLLHIYAEREVATAPVMHGQPSEEELAHSFEYDLTPDQKKSLEEIYKDLGQARPMDRLVCGDVGFGKTELAIRAAFRAVLNHCQVAVLCPTTILTQQHYDTFCDRLDKFGVNISLLSRFENKKQQAETVSNLKSGKIDIIIGTHRLLSKDIKFKNLGLIIIDEEQKFGVRHKEKLKELRSNAHILTLTATPIPRTLNLALSGLRSISSIRTPPPGRMSIETIIAQDNDQLIRNALETELKRKGQAYFLYNKVETIQFAAKRVQKLAPKAKIGVAHGQQDAKSLSQVMSQFDNQEIDILICSTIIENGLDIPNANTLIVENAPNFGLAQLYQIRGRIGRSHRQAYAYFLYNQEKLTDEARKRLKALKEASAVGSGYELAMKDLEQRGVGAILGKKQHGHAQEVGLNLYLRLLNQSVKELKKETDKN